LVVDYPAEIMEPVWEFVGELADEGQLISPRVVFDELRASGIRRVVSWAKQHQGMFLAPDELVITAAGEVAHRYEGRFVPTSRRRSPGDLWVVALALVRQRADEGHLFRRDVFVVQHESRRRNRKESKPKIPDVCDDVGLRCLRLPEMVVREEAARRP
jgi:hypothetical protein